LSSQTKLFTPSKLSIFIPGIATGHFFNETFLCITDGIIISIFYRQNAIILFPGVRLVTFPYFARITNVSVLWYLQSNASPIIRSISPLALPTRSRSMGMGMGRLLQISVRWHFYMVTGVINFSKASFTFPTLSIGLICWISIGRHLSSLDNLYCSSTQVCLAAMISKVKLTNDKSSDSTWHGWPILVRRDTQAVTLFCNQCILVDTGI